MKDRKLSKTAQAISATAVLIVFGGGAATAYRWPHIQFLRVVRGADEDTRAKWHPAEKRELPANSPDGWIPVDLGIASFAVPPPVVECRVAEHPAFRIMTDALMVTVVNIEAGRELMDADLQGPSARGGYERQSFMAHALQAAASSPDDFSWAMRWDQVWQLQENLLYKGVGHAPVRPGIIFNGGHVRGLASYADPALPSSVTVLCAPHDDRDLLCCYCLPSPKAKPGLISGFLSSIRFPATPYKASPDETRNRLEAVAASFSRAASNAATCPG